jgi:hypothetical protein
MRNSCKKRREKLMGEIKLNKETYQKLIADDIRKIKESMRHCLERAHIISILEDSVNVYYPDCPLDDLIPHAGKIVEVTNAEISDIAYDATTTVPSPYKAIAYNNYKMGMRAMRDKMKGGSND